MVWKTTGPHSRRQQRKWSRDSEKGGKKKEEKSGSVGRTRESVEDGVFGVYTSVLAKGAAVNAEGGSEPAQAGGAAEQEDAQKSDGETTAGTWRAGQ